MKILFFALLLTPFLPGCSSIERSLFVSTTNSVPDAVTGHTNQVIAVEVRAAVKDALTQTAAINSAMNPTPTALPIHYGLGALSGLLSILAGIQTRRLNKAQSATDANAALLQTVIAGVEATGVPAVKESIAKLSQVLGTAKQLDAAVQSQTQ
jgi:hypothetical protein